MSELKDKPRWVKKMTTLFMQLDVNKSGYITKDDWLRLGYRVAEKNGYDIQRNPKAIALISTGSQFYDELSLGKQSLIEGEFIQRASEYLAQQHALREHQTTATQAMIDALFEALDMDSNGWLSPREWEVYFYMWNLPDFETKSAEAFKLADKNHDGMISLEEYRNYNFEFWMTDEDEFGIQGMFGSTFNFQQ